MAKKPNANASLAEEVATRLSAGGDASSSPEGNTSGPPEGVLEHRNKVVASQMNRVRVNQVWVDPNRCRIWERHNRDYSLLNEDRCDDLIRSFQAMEQKEPAVVRPVEDDSGYEFEVICGARRHWTASYLGKKYLVQVERLDDEQAFRRSDAENRDRQDISDYERALDYKKALDAYYDSQRQMADRLSVSEDWLSSYLNLASLPSPIVAAYRDITELKVYHGKEYQKLLRDKASSPKVLERARELKGEGLDGKTVLKQLKAAAARQRGGRPKRPSLEVAAKNSGERLVYAEKGKRELVLKVSTSAGADKDEMWEALKSAMDQLMGSE